MRCACDSAPAIAAHFDAKVARTPSSGGLHAVTRALLELMGDPGGRSVLELGSGRGGLMVELLRSGASTVAGLDLSGASVAAARERLAAEGLADRAVVEVGDGATCPLPPRDWVVLDRVICCYPDAAGLVANSMPAARSLYVFSVPESRGWAGLVARLSRALDNGWNRFRGRSCATFVHDIRDIDRMLAAGDFRLSRATRRGLWRVAVYERARRAAVIEPAGPS
jgi:SAM-dependent methyltransferase